MDNVTALQGQLQQLFHLHDAGVDQSFIDTLPVFNYKAIIGVKSPFDCAVCLSEFEYEDKLRLLPKCSHAFHMECIDTWLLSHSTCPLCRGSLLPDFSSNNPPNCSPIVLVLESGSDSSREIVSVSVSDRENIARVNSHLSSCSSALCDEEFRQQQQQPQFPQARPPPAPPLALADLFRKSCEIQEKDIEEVVTKVDSGEKIVRVKLGKFRNVDGGIGGEGSSDNNNVDERRCFSMGSFAYIMDENTSLQVPIRTPLKKQPSKKPALPLLPGHRPAMSECGGDSRREFINGFEAFKSLGIQGFTNNNNTNTIESSNNSSSSRAESFSISKIWLRGKKERPNSLATMLQSSRRAFSFRFPPVHHHRSGVADESKQAKNGGGGGGSRRTVSEIDVCRWENGGSEFGLDLDTQSCNSIDSQANPHSFARRTLLWLMGRQNKVVHSTFPSNV